MLDRVATSRGPLTTETSGERRGGPQVSKATVGRHRQDRVKFSTLKDGDGQPLTGVPNAVYGPAKALDKMDPSRHVTSSAR
jgi:hypothetical protein